MTKRELIVLREQSYKPPPEQRCETCRHFNVLGDNCLAIEIRGHLVLFQSHSGGWCQLWTAKA